MAYADPQTVTANLATILSNQILSADNTKLTVLDGQAFMDETYIDVRWPWILLSLIEIVLTFILCISIIITRREPLLKSSAIALLLQDVGGWHTEELRVEGKETEKRWTDLANVVVVALERNDEGEFRFVRASY